MATKYSALRLLADAFGRPRHEPAWRKASLQPRYDAIVVGGGGHGLATAYYLAKRHGLNKVALLERGLIGQGNVGRNTTIVRSNYLIEPNTSFYAHSLKLWESLSQELNFNVMFSQRGLLMLAHSPGQLDYYRRLANTMLLAGSDAELLNLEQIRDFCPLIDLSPQARFPVLGALLQRRAGTARHDAVAWGYARAASDLGVDIVENCAVTGFEVSDNKVQALHTTQGTVRAEKVGLAVAGRSSLLAAQAGLGPLPIESHLLQAFVTEALKPIIDGVVTFGYTHFYISQSDKGGLVFGGDIDGYNSYAARGNLPAITHVAQCGLQTIPALSRLKVLRHWGGIMDMSMDGSPIIGLTPIQGLYLNAGWCYGGFKATPASGWCFAHTMAHNQPHELNAAYSLDRFAQGQVIDEGGGGAKPNMH